ncbi:MAG TPA: hypothetical protein VHE80_10240 [Acidimicrobiales bacterium]|nr:hypothetical protein [Acidimicrobiales bacterium]
MTTAEGLHPVRLAGVPTDLFVTLQMHIDELLRELEIIEMGEAAGSSAIEPRLRHIMRDLLDLYVEERQAVRAQAEQAAALGSQRVDMEVALPEEAVAHGEELLRLFEQADELSRQGLLLTVPSTDDLAAFRRWILAEVSAQIRTKASPTPCPL